MSFKGLKRLQILSATLLQSKQLHLLVFTIVLIVLSGILLHSSFRKGGLWNDKEFNDFRAYHNACRLVLSRELHKAYEHAERPYQYPPTLAAILTPLGLLSEKMALVVWAAGCLGLLLWCFRAIDGVLCPPVLGIDKFLGFLLVYRLVESDFANSNANILILAAVVGGFHLERMGRPAWGGQLLALASCIKVFPILLLPWMVYRKRWRMTVGFFLGLAVWGALVPGTIIGPADFSACWKAWHRQMIAPLLPATEEIRPAEAEYVPGQSLRSFLYHILRRTDATAHDAESIAVNVADWPKQAVEALYWGLALVILGLSLWSFYDRSPCNRWSGLEIAAAALLTVLLSPLARKAHFVLLFPAAVLGCAMARLSLKGLNKLGKRRWPLPALWLSAAALVILSSHVLGDRLSALAMAYCPLTWASLALLALLISAQWRWKSLVD